MRLAAPLRGVVYGVGALVALMEWHAGTVWLALGFAVLVTAGMTFEVRR